MTKAKVANNPDSATKVERLRLHASGRKVRNVIGLVYIEDLETWGVSYGDLLAYLDHLHVKAVVSPIHDRDHFTGQDVRDWCERHLDPETGDLDTHYLDRAPYVGKSKKPHCHVGILLKYQKTAAEFSELFSGLCYIRPTIWEQMLDYEGFVRYLAHLDSPQKARYDPLGIHGFGGADLSPLLKEDKEQRVATTSQVWQLVRDNDIRYFHRLVDAAFASSDLDLKAAVMGNASLWASYMSSKGAERKARERKRAEKAKASPDGKHVDAR